LIRQGTAPHSTHSLHLPTYGFSLRFSIEFFCKRFFFSPHRGTPCLLTRSQKYYSESLEAQAMPVFNYPLSEEHFAISYRSSPMASQRSSISTDSNYLNSFADSYASRYSSQPHGYTRHATGAQATHQYPSFDSSHNQDYQQSSPSPSTTLSERDDR
jgi:hypothetical protein